jgi:hypothetical protein
MFPQQGWRNTGGGGSGGTNLTIQNTLWVMKNGDDATALPNRLDKPFLTIYEATQQAVAGDTIYVVSGIYDEGTKDIFADSVNYVLEDGVTVQCDTKVVSDFGNTKTINISGNGILQTTVAGEGVVYMTVSNSVLNLECKQIIGEGIAIACTGYFNINVNYVSSTTNIGIYFSDSLGTGGLTFGTINVDKISVLSGYGAIKISGTNTDLNEENIYINCNELINQSSKAGGSAIQLENNNETNVYVKCKYVNQLAITTGLFESTNSRFFINNTNFEGFEYGLFISGDSVGLISNTNVLSVLNGISCIESSNVQLNNCTIKSTGAYVSLELTGTSQFFALNTIFVSGTGISSTVSISDTNTFRVRNCQFIASDPATIYSISSSSPTDIYVYGQCSSNKPTESTLTNQVAGTNIVVDADIIQNTTNFY